MMKLFYKISVILITLLLMATSIAFGIKKGYFDYPIKVALEFYLTNKNLKTKINNLYKIEDGFAIEKISSHFSENNLIELEDIKIITNINWENNIIITARVNIGKTVISSETNEKILLSNPTIEYNFQLPEFISHTKMIADRINSDLFEEGHGVCEYNNNMKKYSVNCDMKFSEYSNISFNGVKDFQKLAIQSTAKNIPIKFAKIIKAFLLQYQNFVFLNEAILAGDIIDGELNLHLNKAELEKLDGKFHLKNLEFKYADEFPVLKDAELNLILSESALNIAIKQAYTGKTLISEGTINLDLRDLVNAKMFIKAQAVGPAVDLINFISSDHLSKIADKNIDLKKISGTANSVIDIVIPMDREKKTLYDISTNVKNTNLQIFNGKIKITDGNVFGKFDGNHVILSGKAKINNFDSLFEYKHNLFDTETDSDLLKIKTTITDKNQKIGIANILSGVAIVDMEYKRKDNKSEISLKSDLKKLEFFLDYISVHKFVKERAFLNVKGVLFDSNGNIEFKLTGDNNLNITGLLNIKDNKYKIGLPVIQHNDNNLAAELLIEHGNFLAKIKGKQIDLSNIDLTEFLQKNKEKVSNNLEMMIGKVKLKNNIWLDDLKFELKCNKIKCLKGYLNSKIGSKSLNMMLKTFDNKEEWVISCDNAGALLRAIGIFKNMKAGSILLTLNSSRIQTENGQNISLLDGSLTLKKFIISNMPFFTRVVSFISLPGFMNFITNKQDIIFSDMEGKFNYKDDVINISKAMANGPYFNFSISGNINTKAREIKLKGQVLPSLYGISSIVDNIPVLGNILSGGNKKGVVSAPYSIEQKY